MSEVSEQRQHLLGFSTTLPECLKAGSVHELRELTEHKMDWTTLGLGDHAKEYESDSCPFFP